MGNLKYYSSVEKWRALERIARYTLTDMSLADACRDMCDYIRRMGDERLGVLVVADVQHRVGFQAAIYHSKNTPCPHCEIHNSVCIDCQLFAGSGVVCCEAWVKVTHHV